MAFKNNSCFLLLSSKMPSLLPTSDFSRLDPWPGQKHRFWLRYPEWSLSSVTNQLYDWRQVTTPLYAPTSSSVKSGQEQLLYELRWPVVKNPPAITRDTGDVGSFPRSGRSLEEEMATHSSILDWEIPMDRGAWWATVSGVTKSQTRLSTHTCIATL